MNKIKALGVFLLAAMILLPAGCTGRKAAGGRSAALAWSEGGMDNTMKKEDHTLVIQINGQVFHAELEKNPSVDGFLKKLPLEMDMQELNGNEKYYILDRRLPSADKSSGTIHVGDLMLYDSRYVVLFYKDFPTSYRYTPLGRITNPEKLSAAVSPGPVKVQFAEVSKDK